MNILARFLARPAVVDWLIRRATRTPYTHIVKNGDLYMQRFWLFNPYPPDSSGKGNWMPSVRLHRIVLPDQDRHRHDHPWDARSFVLLGWYDEERLHNPSGAEWVGCYRRRAGTSTTLKFGEFHNITEVSDGGVWTLFITWRYRGTWGFLVDGVKVPWRTYLGLDK